VNGNYQWFPFAKGGSYSPYYSDLSLVVNWKLDGGELKAWAGSLYGGSHWSRIIKNTDYYFESGLTYPLRTSRFSPQVLPYGTIISVRGSGIYGDNLSSFLGILASAPFDYLIKILLGRDEHPQFDMGDINVTPVPVLHTRDFLSIDSPSIASFKLKQSIDSTNETSHVFHVPALLQVDDDSLNKRIAAWQSRIDDAERQLAEHQREIDDIAFRLYDIGDEDRRAIESSIDITSPLGGATPSEVEDTEPQTTDSKQLTADLFSHSIGCAFGRWDVRYATGERAAPKLPDPFAPLPICAPGTLTDDNGLPASHASPDYPLQVAWNGILVDDLGHKKDLLSSVRDVFGVVWTERAEEIYREAVELLDSQGEDLRHWFRKNFFDYHIKHYSKSRRKAPIYWQLATPTASYSVWLYYHYFTKDTFYTILNDYVKPKLNVEELRLARMRDDAGPEPTRSQHKEIEQQEIFVEELKTFREEVERVAPLWHPDLNDGVIINFAPLWRLVTHHKAWQKECKAVWDKLVAGDYDWAHLAMHLWPERVVPKCQKDVSLAIAHGLEDAFWEQDEKGKWQKKQISAEAIQKLIDERASVAVKAALDSLLSAQTLQDRASRRRTEPNLQEPSNGAPKPAKRRKKTAKAEGPEKLFRKELEAQAAGGND
jgi:hypothetical protein